MLENTEGAIKKHNPEKLVTQGAQDTGQINVREYRRGKKKDNPESTLGARDTGQIHVREYRRGNQKWTIQRNWQHRVHKTQDKYMFENTEGAIKKDNPEKLATQGIQDTGQINVREYPRGNKKV